MGNYYMTSWGLRENGEPWGIKQIVDEMIQKNNLISPHRVQDYASYNGPFGPRPEWEEICDYLRTQGYIVQGSYDTLWKSEEERNKAGKQVLEGDTYDSYK